MLEQKFHIRPCRKLIIPFVDVEKEIRFRRHLLALVAFG
jgi:hypothetical protein